MSGRIGSLRTYEFRPPSWQPRRPLNTRLLFLAFLTLGWLTIYGTLAVRLWRVGVTASDPVGIGLALLAFLLGVPLALAWWASIRRWRARLQPATWPALNVTQMMALTPSQFEEYVAQRIFARQGYAVENTPDVADGGVDILVTDRQGRRAVVQCKRYRATVGEATVRDLYGAMIHNDAGMAFLVTTANISDAARRWAAGKPIDLIDGARLELLARAEPGPPSRPAN